MAKALGITDAVITCDCCGKTPLKSTVIIQLDSGEIVHYGSVCANRNTGKSNKVINSEIKSERERRIREAEKEIRNHPAEIAYRERLAERDRIAQRTGERMPGRMALEFVWETSVAAEVARAEIARKWGLSHFGF